MHTKAELGRIALRGREPRRLWRETCDECFDNHRSAKTLMTSLVMSVDRRGAEIIGTPSEGRILIQRGNGCLKRLARPPMSRNCDEFIVKTLLPVHVGDQAATPKDSSRL
jgi:hypothetical protein